MTARDELRAAAVSLDAFATHYSATPAAKKRLAESAAALRALADRWDWETTRVVGAGSPKGRSERRAIRDVLARLDADLSPPLQKEPR